MLNTNPTTILCIKNTETTNLNFCTTLDFPSLPAISRQLYTDFMWIAGTCMTDIWCSRQMSAHSIYTVFYKKITPIHLFAWCVNQWNKAHLQGFPCVADWLFHGTLHKKYSWKKTSSLEDVRRSICSSARHSTSSSRHCGTKNIQTSTCFIRTYLMFFSKRFTSVKLKMRLQSLHIYNEWTKRDKQCGQIVASMHSLIWQRKVVTWKSCCSMPHVKQTLCN